MNRRHLIAPTLDIRTPQTSHAAAFAQDEQLKTVARDLFAGFRSYELTVLQLLKCGDGRYAALGKRFEKAHQAAIMLNHLRYGNTDAAPDTLYATIQSAERWFRAEVRNPVALRLVPDIEQRYAHFKDELANAKAAGFFEKSAKVPDVLTR